MQSCRLFSELPNKKVCPTTSFWFISIILLIKSSKNPSHFTFSVAKIINNLILCKKYYNFFDVYEFLLLQISANNEFYKQYLPTTSTRRTSDKE